jgi:precorrin-2 dehydrogenase/sirohydrochlorin ferrochelatase
VNLDVNNRPCLVVGGGSVGTRKTETLIRCGARVTVVSRDFTEPLRRLSDNGRVSLHDKDYDSTDMESMFLAFAATSDRSVNDRVRRDAEANGILFNIADDPRSSVFVLPALVERGDLTIAVSTSGNSPAFARKIRTDLELQFGDEYGDFLFLMGRIRKKLLAEQGDARIRKELFDRLAVSDIPAMLKRNDIPAVNDALAGILGPGFRYENLRETGGDDEP